MNNKKIEFFKDEKRKEFKNILRKLNIYLKEENNKIIINDSDRYIISDLITFIPDNVEFNNIGFICLGLLYEINENNIHFNNEGNIYLDSLQIINGNNIQFNNKGFVKSNSLQLINGNNIQFNNNGYINLYSLEWFKFENVKFNNKGDIYFGPELFWGKEFPYPLINNKGDVYLKDEKLNK